MSHGSAATSDAASASGASPGTPSEVSSIGTSVSQRQPKKPKSVHPDTFMNRVQGQVGKAQTPSKKKRKVPKAPPAAPVPALEDGVADDATTVVFG